MPDQKPLPLPASELFARKSEIIRQFIRKHARRLDGEGGAA